MQDMINGVDRSALSATISAIQADPGLAGFRFRISNEWLGGGLNRSTVTDFHGTRQDIPHQTPFVLMNDEPPVLLSGDKGPNPVENLLHALSGCLTTSLVYHAAARGIRLAGVRTRLEGDLDLRGFLGLSQEVRRGYQGVRVVFEIDGDLTVAEKRDLVAMAASYSPVYDVVTNGTPVACRAAEDAASAAAA